MVRGVPHVWMIAGEELVLQRKRAAVLERNEKRLKQMCDEAEDALRVETGLNHMIATEAHRLHIIITKCYSVVSAAQDTQEPPRELQSIRPLRTGHDVFRCSCALLQQVRYLH